MQEKDIKRLIKKQLKNEVPNWSRIPKKKKKLLAKEVLEKVVKEYPFEKGITVPMNELIGIPAIDKAEIIPVSEMEDFILRHKTNIIHLPNVYKRRYIADAELRAIDELLDNEIINKLLAPKGYTPCCRTIFPSHLFRAELLKSIKYPELSYRKYCDNQVNKLEQKTNRTFIGLSLREKVTISHSQLSQFRSGLTFSQMVNLMAYTIHLFIKSGIIDSRQIIHGVDSAELPAVCSPKPLATIEVRGKKVRIYGDLDADCGKRRNKRDKSEYFVGYRIHSLTAINAKTGHSYPIISLIVAGNHHDNLILPELVKLGKAIGLDLKIITADEAYNDVEQNEAIKRDYGVTVVSASREKVKLPEYVDEETKSVYMNKWCETPMSYLGITEEGKHEFKCNAESGICFHDINCPKYREIPVDAGNFGQIPDNINGVKKVKDLRKNVERPFNLLKHRDGLEPVRVRSQRGLMAVSTFVNIANLLLEIVATRKTERKESNQLKLKLAA